MFGLFKSAPFFDPRLGEFVRSYGYWRGTLHLDSRTTVPIALAGTRSAPDAAAVAAAFEAQAQLSNWRPAIERALFDHYEPYAEALAAGEFPAAGEAFPRIAAPADVWPHVALAFIAVAPLGGYLITELGYTTAWDEDHTLGARFDSGKLVELCGSTLAP